MISDLDVWRCAHLLIKQHGDGAEFDAAGRADDMLAKGDVEGQRVWMLVLKAIRELQRTVPREGEHLN
jgi:hypothetical protein